MALQFKFRKEKIILDAKFFMFKEFVDIWEWDKTKSKDKANPMLYFIWMLCDLGEENPIRDYPPDSKYEEAMRYAYGINKTSFTKKELSLLEPAVECYKRYNNSAEERISIVFDDKSDEIRDMLEDQIPTTETYTQFGVTKFVSNAEIITGALTELKNIRLNKAQVIAAIKKEAMSNKVRGQVYLTPLSKGVIPLPDFSSIKSQ